ncbi:MAG: aldo/keto reductase, partial [Chitinispirillaceae bacterium]|nr:aldo/keto reductase [Chitinispirillaceae bacterium]
PDDHRTFNRRGEAFDRGETFSGVEYETALAAIDLLRPLVPEGTTMTQMALRWILMFPEVTCAIPGAKRPSQVEENVAAASLSALSPGRLTEIERIYREKIRPLVHHYW